MFFRVSHIFSGFLLAATAVLRAEDFQGATHTLPFDDEAIFYSNATPADRVGKLQRKIERGEVRLRFDPEHGYLPAVLDYFGIPRSSQGLVFSKTSAQRAHISPARPRAIYFNDDVYVGYIPGAPLLEVSAVDPQLGGMFYALDQTEARRPQFVRESDCLSCHAGPRTLGVPGHVLRSVATEASGEPRTGEETSTVDHTTPLAERWAGWFVTGTHGAQTHLGNLVGRKAHARPAAEAAATGNVRDLRSFTDATPYLEPGSDLVARMVLDHQSKMHNYITRLAYETRIMQGRYGHIRYLKTQQTAFLRYLLFAEETPLTAPVAGTTSYAAEFAKSGPRDAQGRSLRDLDLQTRLFKYPCSFLIHSPAFDALPEPMRGELLQRLHDILTGKDTGAEWAGLPAVDRRAVLEILRATKPNLPAYWRAEPAGG